MTPNDNSVYLLLTLLGADIQVQLVSSPQSQPKLMIVGNRAGLFSIANVFLWFVANASRREFFALGDMPFVSQQGSLTVVIRMTAEDSTGTNGTISRNGKSEQFEWSISNDDLLKLALLIHHLASVPEHEFDDLHMSPDSEASVHIRMIDAKNWIPTSRP